MRLALVVQRYGLDIAGGAEYHCRLVAEHLARHASVAVLTTCASDYVTWANDYPEGEEVLNGVPVRRFAVEPPPGARPDLVLRVEPRLLLLDALPDRGHDGLDVDAFRLDLEGHGYRVRGMGAPPAVYTMRTMDRAQRATSTRRGRSVRSRSVGLPPWSL